MSSNHLNLDIIPLYVHRIIYSYLEPEREGFYTRKPGISWLSKLKPVVNLMLTCRSLRLYYQQLKPSLLILFRDKRHKDRSSVNPMKVWVIPKPKMLISFNEDYYGNNNPSFYQSNSICSIRFTHYCDQIEYSKSMQQKVINRELFIYYVIMMPNSSSIDSNEKKIATEFKQIKKGRRNKVDYPGVVKSRKKVS